MIDKCMMARIGLDKNPPVEQSYIYLLQKRSEGCVLQHCAANVVPSNVYVGQIPIDFPSKIEDCVKAK
jgi:hypothetical protein